MYNVINLVLLNIISIKQLLDEAEHDIKNHPDRGQSYLPKSKAEMDNIYQGLGNS